MSEPARRSIAELLADHALITAAITRGVREAVLQHARAGHPVAEGRDGKVIWIPPQEILTQLAGEPVPQEAPAAKREPSAP
jgi:hypothetical protein